MDINDKLELLLIENDIVEQLFIGKEHMLVNNKYGEPVILMLTGLRDVEYYKWDIKRCEERASHLIDSVVLMEQTAL